MKAFLVSQVSGGIPDFSGLPHFGSVLCAITPNREWGLYLIAGTGQELLAIDELSQVYGLCLVSMNETSR
jgi:hypothetical protein